MYQSLKNIGKDIIVYLVMCIATLLMLRTIIGYAGFSTTYAFLQQKQDYLTNNVWKAAFYTHVFTSLVTLIAGFTQFSRYMLVNRRTLHKVIGKVYVFSVLFINVPAGFIMAIYANGLWPSKLAFLILDVLWALFTWKAWRAALRRNFKKHKEYMIRSYALTFSAITLRTWKLILSSILVIDPLSLYMIDTWLAFVPNLLLAEWIIRNNTARVKIKLLH